LKSTRTRTRLPRRSLSPRLARERFAMGRDWEKTGRG
jgi:hypothetical protein